MPLLVIQEPHFVVGVAAAEFDAPAEPNKGIFAALFPLFLKHQVETGAGLGNPFTGSLDQQGQPSFPVRNESRPVN
jgi:hypothetical protein